MNKEKEAQKKAIEVLVVSLVQGTMDVNKLDLARADHRDAFFKALKQRPAILSRVSKANSDHFLNLAIRKHPEYFVHLKRSQYKDDIAQLYLFQRFANGEGKADKSAGVQKILVRKSFEEKVILTYSYITDAGDDIYYYDKELDVPVSLKSSLMLTLKIDDALKLIDKLDIHITQLGEHRIKAFILDVIANQYKAYLSSYIKNNDVGYYTLCTSLADLGDGFKKDISDAFKEYGIIVNDVVIKNLAIPKDIQTKIEDQAFRIRQHRADIAADAEFAKVSLESYEAKLAIQAKYPSTDHSLTEYEKDLALKRYLTKVGRLSADKLDRTISIADKSPVADSTVYKKEDIIPDIPKKPNPFRTWFCVAALIAVAVLVALVVIGKPGLGLIAFGICLLPLGVVAALYLEKLKTQRIEPTIQDGDEESTVSISAEEVAR